MVFVLLTYGGWNEAAYLSAEVRGRRGIVAALLIGIALVMGIYLLVNAAYLAAVGMEGMAKSQVVAADMMRTSFGDNGARLISLIIVVAAVGNINGTIITGARTNYALGRDFPILAGLSRWKDSSNTPTNALIVQGVIALLLVVLGAFAKNGFTAMVEYTAPVFWLFFLLAGAAVIVLRQRERDIPRPFKTPLYPLTPVLFCAACGYMLYSSLDYAGRYSWIGVAVLAAGVPLLLAARRQPSPPLAPARGFPIDAAAEAVQQQI
jgi:amino acid transporter